MLSFNTVFGLQRAAFTPQSIFLQKNGKKYRKEGKEKRSYEKSLFGGGNVKTRIGRESKLQLDSGGRAGKDILFRYSDSFDDRRVFGKNSQRKNGLKRLYILRISNIIEACKSAEAPKRYLWREQANIKKPIRLLHALKTSGGRGCIFVCPARTATK